ncbi:MAG: zinc ribbon domain-containing protein [Lachnospiraceae bacterium]|nr:zinc ribbon domain-containing protein [Lachnospiraceae bacterium]
MVSWEQIKGKISDTNDVIVSKTRAFAESVRIKGTLSDMEKDRDKLYSQLGRLFYEDRYGRMKVKTIEKKISEMPDEDPKKGILIKVLELKQSEVALAQMESERKRLLGYIKCPACGADVAPDCEFCIECGARIKREEAVKEAPVPDDAADEEDIMSDPDKDEADNKADDANNETTEE